MRPLKGRLPSDNVQRHRHDDEDARTKGRLPSDVLHAKTTKANGERHRLVNATCVAGPTQERRSEGGTNWLTRLMSRGRPKRRRQTTTTTTSNDEDVDRRQMIRRTVQERSRRNEHDEDGEDEAQRGGRRQRRRRRGRSRYLRKTTSNNDINDEVLYKGSSLMRADERGNTKERSTHTNTHAQHTHTRTHARAHVKVSCH